MKNIISLLAVISTTFVTIYKDSVAGINVDEDDYEIASMGYNIWTGKNGDSTSYNIKKWNIKSDDDGNIIITRK